MKAVKPRIVIVTDNPNWQQSEAEKTSDYELVFTDFAALDKKLTEGRIADFLIIASNKDEPTAEIRNSILLARQIGMGTAWANPESGLTQVLEEVGKELSRTHPGDIHFMEKLMANMEPLAIGLEGDAQEQKSLPSKDWRSVMPQAAGGHSDGHHAKPPRLNHPGPPRTRS